MLSDGKSVDAGRNQRMEGVDGQGVAVRDNDDAGLRQLFSGICHKWDQSGIEKRFTIELGTDPTPEVDRRQLVNQLVIDCLVHELFVFNQPTVEHTVWTVGASPVAGSVNFDVEITEKIPMTIADGKFDEITEPFQTDG